MIHYIKGDATQPVGDGPKLIVHICNDIGAWGAGFVMAISRKWKQPESEYRRWHLAFVDHTIDGSDCPTTKYIGPPFRLGEIQIVNVSKETSVVNMIAQHGIGAGWNRVVDWALEECLARVSLFTRTSPIKSIHMPKIGTGLAGANWKKDILPLIEKTMGGDIDVYVYELE